MFSRSCGRWPSSTCVSVAIVEQHAKAKRVERGGFKRGTLMVGHHAADGRDLLETATRTGQ
jgi:hypothetical protein